MNHSVFLDRAIANMRSGSGAARDVLVPAERAGNHAIGGLELAINRGDAAPGELSDGNYRIISVQHGAGKVRIGTAETEVHERDHFGVPAGLSCSIRQTGEAPLVFLDSRILPVPDRHAGS
jgi:hypothetical protein